MDYHELEDTFSSTGTLTREQIEYLLSVKRGFDEVGETLKALSTVEKSFMKEYEFRRLTSLSNDIQRRLPTDRQYKELCLSATRLDQEIKVIFNQQVAAKNYVANVVNWIIATYNRKW